MTRGPNPYGIRWVVDDEFFRPGLGGRGALAERLAHGLGQDDPLPDSVSIVGERRFGKSSILRRLEAQVAGTEGVAVGLVDMLEIEPQTPAGFWRMITRVLRRGGVIDADRTLADALDFYDLLDDIADRGGRTVLFIDELDLVARQPVFDSGFFDTLRAAVNHRLTLVVASVRKLTDVAHREASSSPFFNVFQLERLRPLPEPEARALLEAGLGAQEDGAPVRDALLALAGGHPFVLQVGARIAFEHDGRIAPAALRGALLPAVSDHFQYVWEHCSDAERDALRSLAAGRPAIEPVVTALRERGYVDDGGGVRGEALRDFVRTIDTPAASPSPAQAAPAAPPTSRPVLRPMRLAPGAPILRAGVVIGVDDCADASGELPRLDFAERDAAAVGDLLASQGYRVERLLGPDATPATVAERFAVLQQATDDGTHPESMLVVHFAGHGVLDPTDEDRAHLALSHFDSARPEDTGLSMDRLVEGLLPLVQVPKVVVMLDACHAGMAAGVRGAGPARVVNLAQQLLSGTRGRMVLAACAGSAQAREVPRLGHGVFTFSVLRHWRDGEGVGESGRVTFNSLAEYVSHEMPRVLPVAAPPVHSIVGEGPSPLLRDFAA